MLPFINNMALKKRLHKTLERMKFKSSNPDSKLYGYFGKVNSFETDDYKVYEIEKFQIREYKNKKKFEFIHDGKKQLKIEGRNILCIMEPDKINKLFDLTDDLTNNSTK